MLALEILAAIEWMGKMWDETYLLSELPSEEETIEEVEFLWDELQLTTDSVVLDLCCGQGRHALQLAKRGCLVIGLDSSRFLMDEALKEIKRRQLTRVKLIEGDMRAIPLHCVCDAVINLYTSFGLFSDADNLTVLSDIALALKPEGKLLLDYWNPYAVAQLDGTRNWWWISDDLLALAEVKYDAASGVLYDYRTVINLKQNEGSSNRKSVIRSSLNQIRFYFPTELEEKLKAVGLRISALYGDFDGRNFDVDSRRLIVVAQHS